MAFSNSFIEQTIKVDSKTTLEKKNIDLADNNYAFLSSFPRSGNGWVRLIFASLILEINGIDINSIKIIRKKTSAGVGYICLNSKENNFDLEDIFPDIYLLDSKPNKRAKSDDVELLTIPLDLIKTHQIVYCNFNKALFLFREPLTCLTSAALLLNKEVIKSDPIKINYTIKYLSKFYNQMIEHYLEQKKQYPDRCFFLHHGYLSDQQAASYFVNSFKFLNPNISVNEKMVQKALAKFPLKSGYDKTLAQNITKTTAIFVKDIIQKNYEKALNFCG